MDAAHDLNLIINRFKNVLLPKKVRKYVHKTEKSNTSSRFLVQAVIFVLRTEACFLNIPRR